MAGVHRQDDQPDGPCRRQERSWSVRAGGHVGRTSGRVYETPIIVAPIPEGFVAELTYGPKVAWYQNSLVAGGCELVVHGESFTIDRISDLDAAAGLGAYGPPRSWVLRLLRRHEFLTMHVAGR